MEIWKDIPGYEGYYQVSEFGNVKSLERVVPHGRGPRRFKGKILKAYVSPIYPYEVVNLFVNAKMEHIAVHRLVALAFVPQVENLNCVNHKDGNKLNNHYSNLEWCTRGENVKHAFRIGLMDDNRGSKRHNAKLTEEDIPVIRSLYNDVGLRLFQIAAVYDVHRMVIKHVLTGKAWRHVA